MLLRVTKPNGTSEEIEVIEGSFAAKVVTSIDWEARRREFEQREICEEESYLPAISFTNDADRTLEFGPNSGETFWVSYRYELLQSTFGFCPVPQSREQILPDCELTFALELLRYHYSGRHQEITTAMPAEVDEG
jgi:hypothetical protein